MVTGTAVKISKMTSIATLTLVLVIVLLYPFLIVNFSDLLVDRSELIIFIQYLVLFISCAGLSSFIYTTIPQMRSSYGRISKVMRGESEPDGMPVPDSFEGPIVSCSNGLVIPVGRETSLVGTSGSGKSETIRCLLRLDDVESGDFTFKGADITELDPRGLRSSIAYAGNLAPAFRGTVRDNVRVWHDISDERLNEAMEAAELKLDPDMFLEKFGSNISMGQIQKISIARALAAEADLYIFDDCFTELDPKTENEIVSNIRKMLEGRTVLFVSHKLRISSGSDGIAVMEDGKVIDTGTHEALVERCTIYRDMYIAGGGIVG